MQFLKFLMKKLLPAKVLRKALDKYFEAKARKYERQYRGDAVFCPCCGKKFRSFMYFSMRKNQNNEQRCADTYKHTVCPNCFSFPRHRIICHYFDKNKQFIPQNNVLIFAGEYAIKKWFDTNDCHYQTADLFDRTSDIRIDIQNIPFPDESWELIVCNHVLEHVPNYQIALKELRRVLTRKGLLEITVPTDRRLSTVYEDSNIVNKKDRIRHFGQYDHLRVFGNNFEEILKKSGFAVEIVDGCQLPTEIGGVVGPMNYDDNRVYICRKE